MVVYSYHTIRADAWPVIGHAVSQLIFIISCFVDVKNYRHKLWNTCLAFVSAVFYINNFQTCQTMG